MKKTILILCIAISRMSICQNFTSQTNVIDNSFSLAYKTMSPTNTYGNRWDALWLNTNEFHIRLPKIILDTNFIKNFTLTSNPKIAWVDETTGQLKNTSKSAITWPWSNITSAPLFLLPIDTNSLSNRINAKFTKPNGTTSQYVRGDGSLSTLPPSTDSQTLSVSGNSLTISNGNTIVLNNQTTYYNQSGSVSVTKIMTFTVSPSTGNGYSIDISQAGFNNVFCCSVIAIKNTGTANNSPQASIKTISNTAIVVNITEGLAVLIGGNTSQFVSSVSGLSLSVTVYGN